MGSLQDELTRCELYQQPADAKQLGAAGPAGQARST